MECRVWQMRCVCTSPIRRHFFLPSWLDAILLKKSDRIVLPYFFSACSLSLQTRRATIKTKAKKKKKDKIRARHHNPQPERLASHFPLPFPSPRQTPSPQLSRLVLAPSPVPRRRQYYNYRHLLAPPTRGAKAVLPHERTTTLAARGPHCHDDRSLPAEDDDRCPPPPPLLEPLQPTHGPNQLGPFLPPDFPVSRKTILESRLDDATVVFAALLLPRLAQTAPPMPPRLSLSL